MDSVGKIAAAVLYEGYVLWPYRRSARKNQQRWTIGGVYPRGHSEANMGSDPWVMQTQCLVTGESPTARITVRFLQVVERGVVRIDPDGNRESVDEMDVAGRRYLAWEEAAEREIDVSDLPLRTLGAVRRVPVDIPAGSEEEFLEDQDGRNAGALVRTWQSLIGTIEVGAEWLASDLYRLSVRVMNETPWAGQDRKETLLRTFASAHTILRVSGGEFVSLMDPPRALKAYAAACENIKTWPVLAGDNDQRQIMLSSPIILYDYPEIAPESGGDFFDGGEIDQLLLLNVMTLTDDEKAEMRASDPRAEEILARSEALNAEGFMRLHGTIREFRFLSPEADEVPVYQDPFATLIGSSPQSVTVGGIEVRAGSRVRLRPRPGRDVMDFALAGMLARVESVEQDYEDRIYLTVTLEGDPGRDMEKARYLGHRFFFGLDEIEPVAPGVPE